MTSLRNILAFILWLNLATVAFAQPQARFAANNPDTVIDHKTGLMWQKQDSFHDLKHGMNWYQALEYVDQKNQEKFAGHADWRMPTMNELMGIWNPRRPLLSKDGEPIGLPKEFSGGGSYYLWTVTERNLNNAWYLGLGQREDYFNLKETGDLDQGVKLVRDHKK